jgi:hypothetical protein
MSDDRTGLASRARVARHEMSRDQFAEFLVANRLIVSTGGILSTPALIAVGKAWAAGPKGFVVEMVEKGYVRGEEQVMTWWPTSRTAWVLISGDGKREVGGNLGPDEVVCDACNAEVATRPVAVRGTYALCGACLEKAGLPFPGDFDPYDVEEVIADGTWGEGMGLLAARRGA